MSKLAVNVDHVATLREARKTTYPDPVTAAFLAELAGADGIVVHLREDGRHIQQRDVRILRDTVQTRLILEMAATDEMLKFAMDIIPDFVTLVPEKREELTTEGGLDLIFNKDKTKYAVENLKSAAIPVSIFIDADNDQIELAKEIGADAIEIHTGGFCDSEDEAMQKKEFEKVIKAAKYAQSLGLLVNAGHGLCYKTIKAFKGSNLIHEFSIGHSIISRAVLVGMEKAVRDMIKIIGEL
ncbi:MAG: pyridoxine 5'-phosphate synthase [Desulforegulaceae bacterium]|nr:pyridoxine 5'-phosphate synthase [Desulforegulaceae bacterium]